MRQEDLTIEILQRLEALERKGTMTPTESLGNWQAPTFTNGWSNYGSGFQALQYTRDNSGLVHIRGVVTGGASGTSIFTLPVGYRPVSDVAIPVASATYSYIRVNPLGQVVYNGGAAPVGINAMFVTAGPYGESVEYRGGNTTISPYQSNLWAFPRLLEHKNGMILATGALTGGLGNGSTAVMFTASGDKFLPGDGVHLFPALGASFSLIRLDVGGGVCAYQIGNNSQLWLDGLMWPGLGTTFKWLGSLPIAGGWGPYGQEYAYPGYMKDKAGQVFLGGLMNKASSTSAGTVIATLPAGYRPPATVLARAMANVGGNHLTVRVNINPDGTVVLGDAVTTWFSFSGLHFHTT